MARSAAAAVALVAALAFAAPAQGFVYWANQANGSGLGGSGTTIGRANVDGSGAAQNFISTASAPIGVAVDGSHIYWANEGTNSIGRANLDGSSADPMFISGAHDPYGVAVDGGHIYWANAGSNFVGRANLDGSAVTQSLVAGTDPYGVAVDAAPQGAAPTVSAEHVLGVGQTSATVGAGRESERRRHALSRRMGADERLRVAGTRPSHCWCPNRPGRSSGCRRADGAVAAEQLPLAGRREQRRRHQRRRR